MPVSPFKRTGLHRLECDDCPGYVYGTVAALEAHGLPRCGCGGRLMPARAELSVLLGLDDCPLAQAYHARLFAFQRGQHAHYNRRGHDAANSSHDAVAAEFAASYAEEARERRLTGLRFGVLDVKPTPDEIPF